MKKSSVNTELHRQYEAPRTKVLQMAAEQTILAGSGEILTSVETHLKDLGGYAGGGDPALAE